MHFFVLTMFTSKKTYIINISYNIINPYSILKMYNHRFLSTLVNKKNA